MVTVISYDLFNQGDINNIMEMNTTEYIHISSRVRKLAVINLGMSTEELDTLKSINVSLNLFSKNFNPKILSSLNVDCCILTSGSLTDLEFSKVSESIKPLIGKIQLAGIGIGKEVLLSTTNNAGWVSSKDYTENKDLNISCFDSVSDSLISFIK